MYKIFLYFLTFILYNFPLSVFAFNDRPFASYFTGNIVWIVMVEGGYYTLGSMTLLILLALIFKKFRIYLTSILMAIFALYLLVLIYEVFEEMSLVPSRYGGK